MSSGGTEGRDHAHVNRVRVKQAQEEEKRPVVSLASAKHAQTHSRFETPQAECGSLRLHAQTVMHIYTRGIRSTYIWASVWRSQARTSAAEGWRTEVMKACVSSRAGMGRSSWEWIMQLQDTRQDIRQRKKSGQAQAGARTG